MLFNSFEYVILLAASALLYWIAPWQKARLVILLVGSCIFYASWDWRFLPLLLGAIIVTFALVRWKVVRQRIAESPGFGWLALTVTLNLLLLGIFKYTNFAIETAVMAGQSIGVASGSFSPLSIILPLGISFFTFQLVAYAVDVHRGTLQEEKSLLKFAVFVAYFPQLIAGPICRGKELLPQLNVRQPFSVSAIAQGLLMLSAGYLIKVGIADNLASYVDLVFSAEDAPGQQAIVFATLSFAMQIFCDFWGYSVMALGSAWLFGIMLPVNVNLPYLATSFQSFWRRWHMTLSFWLRDYLYLPLGGNRKGRLRTYLNLAVVMMLGGLWHGAAFTFLIWGTIHGAALAIERFISRRLNAGVSGSANPLPGAKLIQSVGKLFTWTITMFVVLVGWIFFRAESTGQALAYSDVFLRAAFSPASWISMPADEQLRVAQLFLLAGLILILPLHWLNLMGNNQNFYEKGQVWQPSPRSGGTFAVGVANRPMLHLRYNNISLPMPNALKVVFAFWLFVAGYVLSAGLTVPFIYFQF